MFKKEINPNEYSFNSLSLITRLPYHKLQLKSIKRNKNFECRP